MIQVDVCRGARPRTGATLDELETERRAGNDANDTPLEVPAHVENSHNSSFGGSTNGTHAHTTNTNGNGLSPSPATKTGSSVAWVDLVSPDEAEWETIQNKFHFHPLAIEDAKQQNERAKLDMYDGYLFVSLRAWGAAPTHPHKDDHPHDDLMDVTQEVDVFLGPNYIITIHEDGVKVLDETRKRWGRQYHEDFQGQRNRPSYLLYSILDAMVDDFFPVMDKMDEEIDSLETAIYDDDAPNDTDSLKAAIRLRKRLLLLRQAVTPIREVVNDILRTEDERLLPAGLRPYWQDVYDHALRLVEQIDLHRDILGGVIDAYHAQSSNRLNQVMKTMTGVSTILMSAALISGIYGMNFQFMPELAWHYGYFGALASMIGVAMVLVWYFRKIRWF